MSARALLAALARPDRRREEEEEKEARPGREPADRVQHAAHRDPLPARLRRGDGLLRELDDARPQQRRPLRQRLLPEADRDVRCPRAGDHAPRRPPRPRLRPPIHPGAARPLLLPPLRRPGRRHQRQRLEPLDRVRVHADPALRARQGGADPLRRRPLRPQAEAGPLDRGHDAVPPGGRDLGAADRRRARPRHDPGDRLRLRRDPDRGRGADRRPGEDRARPRRLRAADDR